jgi:hypothetical protein
MIAFKYTQNIDEFANIHPTLRAILLWLHDTGEWPDDLMVITRIFSPSVPGETGVHRTFPHRAADIRTNHLPPAVGAALESRVNVLYDYGDGLHPVAFQHGDGPNRHLHLQVRPGNETHEREV